MAVDWLKIKTEYINGDVSYRKLAAQHEISFSVLKDKAVKEKWADAKEQHKNRVRTRTEQKIVEKTSDALSEEAASKARIKSSMMRLAEGWFVKQEKFIAEDPEKRGINPSDFRKMVQSCVDLGILISDQTPVDKLNKSMEALADLIRNPMPNRNITDFEEEGSE